MNDSTSKTCRKQAYAFGFRNKMGLMIAGALALLSLASGADTDAATAPKKAKEPNASATTYFADYVECNNIPVGIKKLNKEQVAARHTHYRFTVKKDRLVRVSHCNSAGRPVAHEHEWEKDRPVTMVLKYDTKGKVSKRIDADEHGIHNKEWKIKPDNIDLVSTGVAMNKLISNDYFADMEHSFLVTTSNGIQSIGSHGDVIFIRELSPTRFTVTRDPKGQVNRELYKNAQDHPIQNSQREWGRAYKRNKKGQVIQVKYLGVDGKPLNDPTCVCGYKLERNSAGEIVKMVFTTADGKGKNVDRQAWATIEVRRDSATGNLLEKAYFNAEGKPCEGSENYAKTTWKYDKHGNMIEQAFLGANGSPRTQNKGYAKLTRQYDSQGNVTEEAYFDADGAPCSFIEEDGYAKKTMQYDDKGRLTEIAFFDANGQSCMSPEKYAKKTIQYNPDAKQIDLATFGVDGQPCRVEGAFKKTLQYDNFGRLTEEALFNAEGKPTFYKNHAKVTVTYDERGNWKEIDYYGEDGKPMKKNPNSLMKSIAKLTRQYDEFGNKTEEASYDADGKLLMLSRLEFNAAKITWKYDTFGRLIEEAHFGEDDSPLQTSIYKAAKVTWKYDSENRQTEEAFFGPDGKPCMGKPWCIVGDIGYAKKTILYDAKGRMVEEAWFNEAGKPFLYLGCDAAKMTWKYDTSDRLVEVALFGVDGKPCMGRPGFCISQNTSDRKVDGETARAYSDNYRGYAKRKYTYDKQGNRQRTDYDAQGKVIEGNR